MKNIAWLADRNMLITSSWDKTMRYWDVRAPTGTPAVNVECGERIYTMDARGGCAVVGLAEGSFSGSATKEKRILIFDITNPKTPFRVSAIALKCFLFRAFPCLPLLFRSACVSGVRRPGNPLLLCAQ